MTDQRTSEWAHSVQRRVRIVTMLDAAIDAGISPVPSLTLHAIAYFADALAPVWDLRIFDAQLLKRRDGPMSPALQHDVDRLVARGVILADGVKHVGDGDNAWRIDARYSLNAQLAAPVLEAASLIPNQARQAEYVREVVIAVAGLGIDEANGIASQDATYGDAMVDYGDLLDLADPRKGPNPSSRVALRFSQLPGPGASVTSAEMIHLYVRELHGRMSRAA